MSRKHDLKEVLAEVEAAVGTSWAERYKVVCTFGPVLVLRNKARPTETLMLSVNCTSARGEFDGTWHHLSISDSTIPCYSTLMAAKDAFFADKVAVQIHPTRGTHVNIHPNCMHLWVRADKPAAPDFGAIYGMI